MKISISGKRLVLVLSLLANTMFLLSQELITKEGEVSDQTKCWFLTVTPSNQNVISPAGTTGFEVASNISWTVSSNQSWCVVTPSGTGNGTIIATFQDNTEAGTRIATITVSGPGVTDQTVTVTQSGVAPFLTVTPSNQNVESLSGTTVFDVASNIIWTASSSHSWCAVTPSGEGNGTITASFQGYNEVGSRTAVITVSGPGVTDQTVTVTQAGIPPVLSVSPANQYVTSSSGTVSFDVISNISWTTTSDQAWCTVTPPGNGNGTLTVSYQNNADAVSRVAVITVTGAGVDAVEVLVTQDELITISYSGSPWCPSAGPQYVSLTGPAGGVFSAQPEGISIDPATGTITTGTSIAGSYVIKYILEKTEGNRILEASALAGIIPTVAPEIVIKWQDVLVCSNVDDLYTGYQWYLDTDPIAGANGQYYVTNKVPGVYAVAATDKNGCKIFSNTITVEGTKSILAYPNPVKNSFRLSIRDVPTGKTYIRIINESGKGVMDLTTEKTEFEFSEEIPVSNLDKGFYLVQVTVSGCYSYYVKILVIN